MGANIVRRIVRDGHTVTGDELIEHCWERLGSFKVPKHVAFVDTLPKNASGKLLKRDLRASIVPPWD